MSAPPRKKPTRFRFKGNFRIGFRGNEVVEIVRFKKKRSLVKQNGK